MMQSKWRNVALAAVLVAAAPLAAQAQSSWLHVQVNEGGEKASKVQVNLPLAVAEAALAVMPDKVIGQVTEKLAEKEVSIADVRKLWVELKASGDAEFVTVEEADETVRVAREGDWIRVRVDKTGEKAEQVQVDIPITVVDALLSGEGEELNLQAAVAELKGTTGDIVRFTDGDETVRVWIDERNTGA